MYADTPSYLQPLSWLGYLLGLGGAGISRPAGGGYDPNATPTNIYSQPNTGLSDINSINSSQVPDINNTPVELNLDQPGLDTYTGGGDGGGDTPPPGNSNPPAGAPSTGGGTDLNALLAMALQRARGVFNEGMTRLGEKRKQFADVFEQGKGDILQGREKMSGEAQASATGARERNANALRALGLGGSAVERTQGRERQNEAKTQAGIMDIVGQNERGNKEAYQANTDWANSQESSLSNFMNNAGLAGVTGATGLLDQILQSQAAGNAMITGKTVNPYQVDIPSMTGALQGITSAGGLTPGAQAAGDVNINPDQSLSYLDWLRKKSGVSGSGLYA